MCVCAREREREREKKKEVSVQGRVNERGRANKINMVYEKCQDGLTV